MNSALSWRRVLVVEDEVMVSWLLEEMLVDLGYEIVGPAARVNQALAMVDVQAVDMALLDVNLNGEKSYPVADALIASGVPFAFSTGYNKTACQAATETSHYCKSPMTRRHWPPCLRN